MKAKEGVALQFYSIGLKLHPAWSIFVCDRSLMKVKYSRRTLLEFFCRLMDILSCLNVKQNIHRKCLRNLFSTRRYVFWNLKPTTKKLSSNWIKLNLLELKFWKISVFRNFVKSKTLFCLFSGRCNRVKNNLKLSVSTNIKLVTTFRHLSFTNQVIMDSSQ